MIEYLIRSGLVLIILLAIYHLWLENERMHKFNRFYLLFSLFFGLAIPLISIPLSSGRFDSVILPMNSLAISDLSPALPEATNEPWTYDYDKLLLIAYSLIAVVLLIRFLANLTTILKVAAKNRKERISDGIIILIKENVAPHSFLFFTFLNEDDYLNNKIEKEIIIHEFAHIRQKHSIDLLLLEFLMIIFWCNPIFILYKKAMQLNHEFLADEAVIESSCNISAYQQLLLQKATLKTVSLASNLNFSVTKKRFKMMKKQTTLTWKFIKGLSLIPIMAILIVFFTNNSNAQSERTAGTPLEQAAMTKNAYFQGATIEIVKGTNSSLRKKYEELTAAERNELPAPLKPTDELLKSWRDASKFLAIIDFEATNEALQNYKATDFAAYQVSRLPDSKIQIVLLTPKSLSDFKKLGGVFILNNGQMNFRLPPPVVTASKKN